MIDPIDTNRRRFIQVAGLGTTGLAVTGFSNAHAAKADEKTQRIDRSAGLWTTAAGTRRGIEHWLYRHGP
jgi:hypothetical protein